MPFDRVPGWVRRYDAAHPGTSWTVLPGEASAESSDQARAHIAVPFGPLADPTLDGLFDHLAHPWRIGLALVRRGGFAVARLEGQAVVELKIGRRHVQGRTKAGGWSQQRFARRRENQARAAFDAAAEHVEQILLPSAASLQALAVGGDRQAVSSVLGHPQLSRLAALPQIWLGGVSDPTRPVVERAIDTARSVTITLTP